MSLRQLLPVIICASCGPGTSVNLLPVLPVPARTTSDSIVAAVIRKAEVDGRPVLSRRTVFVRDDSGIVSASSLPTADSIDFVVLDSVEVRQAANRLGELYVLTVGRPLIAGDTARSGFHIRSVRRPEGVGRLADVYACAYRLRRIERRWQIDSVYGCLQS